MRTEPLGETRALEGITRPPNPSSFRRRSREGRKAPAKEMPARNHRSAGPWPPCRLPGGACGQLGSHRFWDPPVWSGWRRKWACPAHSGTRRAPSPWVGRGCPLPGARSRKTCCSPIPGPRGPGGRGSVPWTSEPSWLTASMCRTGRDHKESMDCFYLQTGHFFISSNILGALGDQPSQDDALTAGGAPLLGGLA